jgi:hypothetical protein
MKKEILLKVFEAWVTPRLAAYQEPTREGTPRGSSIGFSKTKYYAANLMMLHELVKAPLAELAIKADVSHELIRKWRTEKKFNDLAYYSYRDFVKYVEDHALSCFDKWTPDCEQYFEILEIVTYGHTSDFELALSSRFIKKLLNKQRESSISFVDWLDFFVAYKFSFDKFEKKEITSHNDKTIISTFVLWLLTIILNSNIDPIQKGIIELLLKQLYPEVFQIVLSGQSAPE